MNSFNSDPFGAALAWVAQVLTGTLASTVAIIVIALLGFSLLTGRIDMRRGGRVVIGSFLVFGAQVIASALAGVSSPQPSLQKVGPTQPATVTAAPPRPAGYDPYAGASVPQMQ